MQLDEVVVFVVSEKDQCVVLVRSKREHCLLLQGRRRVVQSDVPSVKGDGRLAIQVDFAILSRMDVRILASTEERVVDEVLNAYCSILTLRLRTSSAIVTGNS